MGQVGPRGPPGTRGRAGRSAGSRDRRRRCAAASESGPGGLFPGRSVSGGRRTERAVGPFGVGCHRWSWLDRGRCVWRRRVPGRLSPPGSARPLRRQGARHSAVPCPRCGTPRDRARCATGAVAGGPCGPGRSGFARADRRRCGTGPGGPPDGVGGREGPRSLRPSPASADGGGGPSGPAADRGAGPTGRGGGSHAAESAAW